MVTKLDNIILPIADPLGGRIDVSVNWRLVESSNVDRIGWDNAGNMYVRYLSGGVYCYLGVSRQRAVAAAYSKSRGRYINKKIKGKFNTIKLHFSS